MLTFIELKLALCRPERGEQIHLHFSLRAQRLLKLVLVVLKMREIISVRIP